MNGGIVIALIIAIVWPAVILMARLDRWLDAEGERRRWREIHQLEKARAATRGDRP